MDTHDTRPTTPSPDTQTDDDIALLEATGEAVMPDGSQATIVIEMENMIRNHQKQIDELQIDVKKHADMLNDVFATDATFHAATEKVKEVAKEKTAVRQRLLNRPEVLDLQNKVKSMKSDIKELQTALSDYLREYQRLSGLTEIEGYDGEMREIVYAAKLVRKSNNGK